MSKIITMYVGRMARGGDEVRRRTLKGFCEEIGYSYSSGKRNKPNENIRIWVVGNKAWEVWAEKIDLKYL